MRAKWIGESIRKRALVGLTVAWMAGVLLPADSAGQGFYGHGGRGPGRYGNIAPRGFYHGGAGWGWNGHVARRPLVGGGVFYHARPHFSSYGRFGAPGCFGYGGSAYAGWGLARPFPYYEPHIYVYPQAPAVDYFCPESAYRRIIIVNLNPEETGTTDVPDHRLPPVPDEAAFRPVQPRAIDPEQAWTYLENGAYQDALTAFGALATANPEDGAHKAGFGLAAALAGDKITAAYALRRAFETDPEGVGSVSLSPPLREKVQTLAAAYSQTMRKDPRNLNVRFLFAAVSHLAQDDAAARTCLASATPVADDSPSAANLRRMLDQTVPEP